MFLCIEQFHSIEQRQLWKFTALPYHSEHAVLAAQHSPVLKRKEINLGLVIKVALFQMRALHTACTFHKTTTKSSFILVPLFRCLRIPLLTLLCTQVHTRPPY